MSVQCICRAECKQTGPAGQGLRQLTATTQASLTTAQRPIKLTYCAGEFPGAFLEQPHDLGLLGRGTAAAHHGRALAGQLHELILIVLEADLGRETGNVSQCHRLPATHPRRRYPAPKSPALTSRESPEMTRAQSCFLRKAFSSRWASPRLVTWKGTDMEHAWLSGNGRQQESTGLLELAQTTSSPPPPSPAFS